MAILAIFTSTIVLNFHHRDVKRGRVPDLLRKVREKTGYQSQSMLREKETAEYQVR